MTSFPYRFRATEGSSAGTTFVYYENGLVVSYRTDRPDHYFSTLTTWDSETIDGYVSMIQRFGDSIRNEMTAGRHAEFEAIPLAEVSTA